MIDRKRFRQGDPEYFEELLRDHGRVVLGVARAYGKDEDHVEDLFQEAWAMAFEKRRSFRGTGPFGGWLHRIATTVCIGDYRDRKKRADALGWMNRGGSGEPLHRNPQTPLEVMEERADHWRLHQALARLSRRELEAISLRILDGRTTKEVAKSMRITQAGVRSIVRHGVRRLRTIMEDMGDEVPGYRSSH